MKRRLSVRRDHQLVYLLKDAPAAVYRRRPSKRKRVERVPSSTQPLRDVPSSTVRDTNNGREPEDQLAATLLPAESSNAIGTESPLSDHAHAVESGEKPGDDIATHSRVAPLPQPDEPHARMRSAILRHMESKLGRLDDRAEEYVKQLAPQQLQDMFNVIYNDMGMSYLALDKAFSELSLYLRSSRTWRVERSLQLVRTSCVTADVDVDGDYEVKIKVGRVQGLLFIRQYSLLMHSLFAVEELQSQVGTTTTFLN